MTVLYILHTTAVGNGATTTFVRLMKGLMAKGVTPVVAMPDKKGIYHILEGMGVDVIATPFRMNLYPYFPQSIKNDILYLPRIVVWQLMELDAVRKITKFAADKGIDIVHSNVSVLAVGYKVARNLGVPHIFHVREYVNKDFGIHFFPSKRTFLKRLSDKHNYTIFIANSLRSYYHKENDPHSIVSYDGQDAGADSLTISEKSDYFLFVGRVEAVKGIDMMLEAYSHYVAQSKSPLPLYIAGHCNRESYKKKISEYTEKDGLSKLVNFLGQRNDVDKLMSHARALIIPSKCEGFGLVFMEAAKNGCLILGRYLAGIKEQIDNGKALEGGDVALSFTDSTGLARLMAEVETTSPSSYKPYLERAFQAANNDIYSQQRNIETVYDFYSRILKEKGMS